MVFKQDHRDESFVRYLSFCDEEVKVRRKPAVPCSNLRVKYLRDKDDPLAKSLYLRTSKIHYSFWNFYYQCPTRCYTFLQNVFDAYRCGNEI